LQEYNIEYKVPKGYLEIDSTIAVINGKTGNLIGRPNFIVKSKEYNLLIGFSFQGPIDTNQKNVFKKSDGTKWDPNKNFIPFGTPLLRFP